MLMVVKMLGRSALISDLWKLLSRVPFLTQHAVTGSETDASSHPFWREPNLVPMSCHYPL